MGCGGSKNAFDTVDDSVHVMLTHDKKLAKKQGKPSIGYVPRAEHPLLAAAHKTNETTQGGEGESVASAIVATEESPDSKPDLP
jgi:hypothetical protein